MAVPPGDVTTPVLQPYSVGDYTAAFQALMPRGRAWPRDADTLQTAVVRALVPTYQRNDAAACELVADIFPSTVGDLLPDWESSLGLPDPCAGEAPTTQGRVAQVVARFTSRGSPTPAFYIAYGATLGFTVIITEFTPLRAGQSVGQPLYNDNWASVWRAEIGTSSLGVSPTVLACEYGRMRPAHTYILVTSDGVLVAPPTTVDRLPGEFEEDVSQLDGPDTLDSPLPGA